MIVRGADLHSGISPQINQHNVDAVLNSVGHDRSAEISAARQIKNCEDGAVDNVFGHAGDALGEVSEAEKNRDQDKTNEPCAFGSMEESSCAIHQITAINGFFAERGQRPGENQRDDENPAVANEAIQLMKIRALGEPFGEERLRCEELERFHRDADEQAGQDRHLPISRGAQSHIFPAQAAAAQRKPTQHQKIRRLAEREKISPIKNENGADNDNLDEEEASIFYARIHPGGLARLICE